MRSPLTPLEQYQCLNILQYLSDLFTAAEKEQFTRVEILSVLNNVANDADFFDPDVIIAQQQAAAECTEVE